MEHLVLLKFNSNIKDTKEEETFVRQAGDMLTKIPGVLQVCAGRSFTKERANRYTHAVRVRLRCKEDLKIYATHPIHLKYKEKYIVPLIDKTTKDPVCAVDFVSEIFTVPSASDRGSFATIPSRVSDTPS